MEYSTSVCILLSQLCTIEWYSSISIENYIALCMTWHTFLQTSHLSRTFQESPAYCPQIICNIPEMEQEREKPCFHLVVKCFFRWSQVVSQDITFYSWYYHAFHASRDHLRSDFVETLPSYFTTLYFTFAAQILLNERTRVRRLMRKYGCNVI